MVEATEISTMLSLRCIKVCCQQAGSHGCCLRSLSIIYRLELDFRDLSQSAEHRKCVMVDDSRVWECFRRYIYL